MSFKNRWTIFSSNEFQAHQQRSQRRCCFSQTALLWFEVLPDMSPALQGTLLCNAKRRPGDGKRVILRQRVRGSVRAVRAVQNTRLFLTETRLVADVLGAYCLISSSWWSKKLQWYLLNSGSSVRISQCFCRYTIYVSIAGCSITQYRSANMRSCNSWILFHPPLSNLQSWVYLNL